MTTEILPKCDYCDYGRTDAGIFCYRHREDTMWVERLKKLREERDRKQAEDVVNHPKHYTEHKSGIECIQITEHMNFCLGNATKYLWRADLKNGVEDLKKAVWYIQREISNREKNNV